MRTPRNRGVTLVELMVVVAVTSVVLAGALVAANAQQRAYHEGRRLRGAQGAARRALLAVERTLPFAGEGIDATLAFDLARWYAPTCRTEMDGCPRDATSNSDELVFYARDPRYWVSGIREEDPAGNAWRIRKVESTRVTVIARAGDVFRKGQIFLAVCPSSSSYAYFTAAETVKVTADGDRAVLLQDVVAANPFRRQDLAAGECFNPTEVAPAAPASPAHLFLVNRYRFHVRPVQIGTVRGVAQYDPVLLLDRGVDLNGDTRVDEADEELLAEGIESMQVSYGFYAGSLAPTGTGAGTALVVATGVAGTAANTITRTPFVDPTPPAPGNAYSAASFFGYTYGPPAAAERLTNAQANIQYVRVAFLARSLETDTAGSQRVEGFLPLMNQDRAPTWITDYANALGGHDGYQRVVLDTTVSLPSMSSRAIAYF